jgi:hypothetical protein
MRLIDYFDRGADLHPNRHCLHDGTRGWTYASVRETTHRVALGLLAAGLGAGAKVAVYSPNHAMAYAALLGIQRAGLVWAPVNARNALDENLFILDNTDVEFLFYHSSFEASLARIREACPKIGKFVCLDRPEFEAWLAQHGGQAPDLPDAPDEVAILISSGGTTGRPKGVQITHRGIETMNSIFWACMPFDGPPVHLMVAPMTHAAGVCSFPMLPYGGTNIFMGTADPGAILAAIEKHRVTHIYMPPTLIYMMLAHPRRARTRLLVAAQPGLRLGADVGRQARGGARGVRAGADPDLWPGRSAMVCTFFSPQGPSRGARRQQAPQARKLRRVAPLMRLEVMDDEGRLLPRGETRRDRGARRSGDEGLLQEPAGDRGGLDVRLAPHRRHRRDRRGRLRLHRRPQEGHDHLRRLQRLSLGGRAGAVEHPRCRTAPSSACPTTNGARR